jgi:energy-coupling factor transporter ATP-binding protein EcfA2
MDYDYSELVAQAKQWVNEASSAGWVSEQDAKPLLEYDVRTPDSLFSATQSRPLIVAFLGGSGVGKSTLLNRLAGEDIARTGVERPTSKEVTLFHHRGVELSKLPEALPIEKIKLAAHDDESKKNIIWIDMPDFDSTEAKNKELVLGWLPHIDVLIYVVSPERYRDNKAWQILLAEGGRHAWVFALNQWDKGQPEQYDDFIKQLKLAGFDNPIVYRTSCVADPSESLQDEFATLQSTIESLATEHTIEQLELRGLNVRKIDLKEKLQNSLDKMGSMDAIQQLVQHWLSSWPTTVDVLQKGFDWPLQRMAASYAHQASHLLSKRKKQSNSESESEMEKSALWDDWAQSRYADKLDELIVKADQLQVPIKPVKQELLPHREKAGRTIHAQTELAVRQALANPGNKIQRVFLKVARFGELVLPLAAIGWVSYQVLKGFHDSNTTDQAYLNTDFAVHSGLLVALAWLLPFFLRKQLKPSMEKTALKGLKQGLTQAMATIEVDVEEALKQTAKQREKYIANALPILERCEEALTAKLGEESEALKRMLI